jgi:hypothetical protein
MQEDIIQSKNQQIRELLNPRRFIYVHHFLTEFNSKLAGTPELRMQQIECLTEMFAALEHGSELKCDVDTEVESNLWMHGQLPPSVVLVIRKLQQFLEIDGTQVQYHEHKLAEELQAIKQGTLFTTTYADVLLQTDALKEFDINSKVVIRLTM